jgi:uncharacterized membrane protein (UPF0127 family)
MRTPAGAWSVRLVHDPADGESRTLAADVSFADGFWERARGLMLRDPESFPSALVFRFGRTRQRPLHMALVRAPVDAVWVADDTVTRVKRLAAWRGVGTARADLVAELPAGAASDVRAGDGVRLSPPTDSL